MEFSLFLSFFTISYNKDNPLTGAICITLTFYIYDTTILFYSEKLVARNFAMSSGVSIRKYNNALSFLTLKLLAGTSQGPRRQPMLFQQALSAS